MARLPDAQNAMHGSIPLRASGSLCRQQDPIWHAQMCASPRAQAGEGELYGFAQSADRVAKKRAIRRRQLKWLWARLKQRAGMKLTREELLMRRRAARKQARMAWRPLAIAVAKDSATFSSRRDRDKLRQARRREARYLLRTNLTDDDPARLSGLDLQLISVEDAFRNRNGDLATPDLSPGPDAHQGAYLHRLSRLLPPRHA